jgi:hypothetical protein
VYVLAEDAGGAGVFEHACFYHQARAAGEFFFARLKNALDGAFKFVAQFVQDSDCAEQRSGVRIVAASVHNALVLRLVRHVVGFLDGQRIHVGSEREGAFARVFALDEGHHAVVGYAMLVLDSEGCQLGSHEFAGFCFLKRKFGVRVQVSAASHGVGVVLMGEYLDFFFHVSVNFGGQNKPPARLGPDSLGSKLSGSGRKTYLCPPLQAAF